MAGSLAQITAARDTVAGELKALKAELATAETKSGPGPAERADNLRRAVATRESALGMFDTELSVFDAIKSGRAGTERGDGFDGASFGDDRDPLAERPIGKDVSLVELLKQSGRTVNDEEWRLGMFGALATGQQHHIARYAKHLDRSRALTLSSGRRLDGPQTKDLLISGSAGNATLTPDVVAAEIIDRLRARTVTQQLGARTLPMRSDTTKIPRITGDPTVSWLAEGATVTASDVTLDSVPLVARRLTGLVKASQEIVEDSDPVSVGQVLQTSFGGALALEVDRVALKGSGTPPEPQGVRNATGVSVNATAAAASWAVIAERIGVLVGANVPVESLGVAVNTASWTTIMGQVDTTGQPVTRSPYLSNLQVLPTGSLAGPATGELYAGNFGELILGIRIALDFQVLRERYLDEGKIGFLPRIRADVGVMHGASFAVRTALSS